MDTSEDGPTTLRRTLRWMTAILGLAALITVVVLSTHDPLGLIPRGKGTYTATVPTPDANQEAALRQSYRNINTRLDDADLVPAARALCRDILGGSSEPYLVESTLVRHASRYGAPVTDDQAHQIITAVKTNGFCHA